jgi:hypothetical protein
MRMTDTMMSLGGRARVVVLIAAIIAALVSCKSKEKKIKVIVDKSGAQAEAKLVAIQNVAKTPLPSLKTSKITYSGAPLKVAGYRDGNLVVFETDVAEKLSSDKYAWSGMFGNHYRLNDGVRGLREPSFYSEEDAENGLKAIIGIQAVLMVKKLAYTAPKMENGKVTVYGIYVGEAHLFEVTGKYAGGVRFAAKSSDKIGYSYKQGTSGESEAKQALANDLTTNTREALEAAIKPFVGEVSLY